MQTFTTPAPITAILGIPAGRIQFTAADRDSTTVEIRPANPSKGRDVKLAEQTTAGYSDGILRIAAPAGNRILGSSGAVEVTVQLPARIPGRGQGSQRAVHHRRTARRRHLRQLASHGQGRPGRHRPSHHRRRRHHGRPPGRRHGDPYREG